MKKIVSAVLLCCILFSFTACNRNPLTAEDRAAIREAGKIAIQYVKDKYDIEPRIVSSRMQFGAPGFFLSPHTATGNVYVEMRYQKEEFLVLVNHVSEEETVCYDNRQLQEVTAAVTTYLENLFHLTDYSLDMHFGYEEFKNYPFTGSPKQGLLHALYTGDNLQAVLEGYVYVSIKTYQNAYLETIKEENLEELYAMLANTDYGLAVLNHSQKQDMDKYDYPLYRATVSMDTAENEIKEKSVYIQSALFIRSTFEESHKENTFKSFVFKLDEYDGIPYLSMNPEDALHIHKENRTVDPQKWDTKNDVDILSDVYSIPIEDIKDKKGELYLFFPVSKMKNYDRYRYIYLGIIHTKDQEEKYFITQLYDYRKVGDYYRIDADYLSFALSQSESFQFVLLGDTYKKS